MKKIIISSILIAIILAIVFIIVKEKDTSKEEEKSPKPIIVNSFEECISLGYPVLESYPRQCKLPDGTTFTEDIGNILEKENLIRINQPSPNEPVISPITIKGEARGTWFFEATFPVKLLDENGNIIKQTYAQAQDDWMTEDFVPFESILTFSVSKKQKGTLVLEKDNPSGLPEYDDELRIPVILEKSEKSFQTVKLYYYNPDLDKDSTGNIMCSKEGLVAVEREIPIINTPIQDTIKLLISGNLTNEEKSQGISTEYPLEGFSLTSASLNNGVLTLAFDDPNNKTSGGSWRTGILWFQIEATAKEFEGIQQVRFLPEELFQP